MRNSQYLELQAENAEVQMPQSENVYSEYIEKEKAGQWG